MPCPEGPLLGSSSHPCRPLKYPSQERDASSGWEPEVRPGSGPREHPLFVQGDTESNLDGDRQVGLLLPFGVRKWE